MKKVLYLGLLLSIGFICYAQEITVTRVDFDGGLGHDGGQWPSHVGPVRARWDSLFDRFNLVRLQDNDPFNPNPLVQRLNDAAINAVVAQGNSMTLNFGRQAYTVYLTMGNRRFIVLLYNGLGSRTRSWWCWVYEVR